MRDSLLIFRVVVPVVVAAVTFLPGPVAAGDGATAGTDRMRAAEARLLKDINRVRVRNGRRPLRLDRRTSQVARARSADMAARRYFAHVEPDGDDAGRLLRRRGVAAASVTENIGHTVGLRLRTGSRRMAGWWYRSAPHRVQMLAREANYVGIGIARRGSRFTYTAIFTRSRDKTRPRVVIDRVSWRPTRTGAVVTLEWRGMDPRLASGTAGIKRFDVQRETAGGGWTRVGGDAPKPRRTLRVGASRDPRLRVRAVDRAGNVGPWAYTRVDLPGRRPRWL